MQLSGEIANLQIVPGSSRVIVVGDSLFSVVDFTAGPTANRLKQLANGDRPYRLSRLAVSHDGEYVAIAPEYANPSDTQSPHPIEIWNLDTATRLHVFGGHDAPINSLSYSVDDNLLASGDELGFVRVWNVEEALQQP